MVDVPAHVEIILGYDRLFRSQILYEAISLEAVLDRIIAWHFCPDERKHGALFSLVFQEGEISFSKKIRMFSTILKQSYPELNEVFGFLPKRLNVLRQLRNKFAHSEVVLPDERSQIAAEGVTLQYLKKGHRVEEFVSRAEVDTRVGECRDLHLAALLLAKIVRGRVASQIDVEQEAAIVAAAKAIRDRLAGK